MRHIIIGGGITGLYLGCWLTLIYPNDEIILFEKSDKLGGRIQSCQLDSVWFEFGAGRISNENRLLLYLIDRMGLNLIKIDNQFEFANQQHNLSYKEILKILIPIIIKLFFYQFITNNNNQQTLAQLAKQKLSNKEYQQLIQYFPFYSELMVSKASDGFASLLTFKPWTDYFIIKEGFSSIISKLNTKFQNKGGTVFLSEPVIEIDKSYNYILTPYRNISYDKLYITVNLPDLLGLKLVTLKQIRDYGLNNEPLLRIYAQYSTCWFKNIGRIVTDLPLRLIIPINQNIGLIMVSYTDGDFAKWWLPYLKDKSLLTSVIQQQLRKLFPNIEIPEPMEVYPCYWKNGGNFNRPNKFNLNNEEILHKVTSKLPDNITIISQTFTKHPNWIEGSLEQVFDFVKNKTVY